MSKSTQNSDNQEIDLSQISKKIGSFFEDIATRFFKIILFLNTVLRAYCNLAFVFTNKKTEQK